MQYMIYKKIKEIFLTFCMITTGIVLSVLIYVRIFYDMNDLAANILWQILVTSFLCSLGNLIHPVHEVGKWRFRINLLLHYLYINVIVLGAGKYFDWFDISVPSMVLGMMALIIVIFIVISAIIWTMEARQSQMLNEKLLEYQRREAGATRTDAAEEASTAKPDKIL